LCSLFASWVAVIRVALVLFSACVFASFSINNLVVLCQAGRVVPKYFVQCMGKEVITLIACCLYLCTTLARFAVDANFQALTALGLPVAAIHRRIVCSPDALVA
jgi:hypothetical protein